MLSSWLEESGYSVDVVGTYSAGKIRLDRRPRFLISELELGAYNGLQLALHARAEHVTPIVIGPPDIVLQREAEQLGIPYLRKDELTGEHLVSLIGRHETKADEFFRSREGLALLPHGGQFVTRRGVPRRISVH